MKLERKTDSKESKERWAFIDGAEEEIQTWDEWKKAEASSIEFQKKHFESNVGNLKSEVRFD